MALISVYDFSFAIPGSDNNEIIKQESNSSKFERIFQPFLGIKDLGAKRQADRVRSQRCGVQP